MRQTHPRRGFTLLEVTLALSVGVLLLAALYVAVDVQLNHAKAGRDTVQQALLVRSILARMDTDVTAASTLIDAERFRMANSSTSGSGGSTGSGSSSGGSSSGGSSTTGTTGSTTSGSSSSSSSTTGGITDNIILPLSVQGDSTSVNLYLCRVPTEAIPTDPNATPLVVSDSRRVSWWMAAGGLARQEVKIVTSQDALDNLPPGLPDEDQYVVAPEVKNVQFQYFDGTDWQDSWDCTTLGADGVTPIGPPSAIAITVDIALPQDGAKDDEVQTKHYRHVVACLSANGITPQPAPATQQQNNSTTGGTGQ
jgi:prepilin-type N-terminal cleavage/methylation domain-containing protein